MTIQISRARDAVSVYEYGCDLRRLYPWTGVTDPRYWGSAIASVRPSEMTTSHHHDEEETFVIMFGQGVITVDGEDEDVRSGDVIYLPRGSEHTLKNSSMADPLVFITIFWGSPEARAAMRELLCEAQEI